MHLAKVDVEVEAAICFQNTVGFLETGFEKRQVVAKNILIIFLTNHFC